MSGNGDGCPGHPSERRFAFLGILSDPKCYQQLLSLSSLADTYDGMAKAEKRKQFTTESIAGASESRLSPPVKNLTALPTEPLHRPAFRMCNSLREAHTSGLLADLCDRVTTGHPKSDL